MISKELTDVVHTKFIRAIEYPEICEKYIQGHLEALANHGTPRVYSCKPNWANYSNVYCVVLQDVENDQILGGVRVHVYECDYNVTLLDEVYSSNLLVRNYIENMQKKGIIGEMCGMWLDSKIESKGYSNLLAEQGCNLAKQLNVVNAFGLAPLHTLNLFKSVGFYPVLNLTKNGVFNYPQNYISYFLRKEYKY